MYMYMYMACVWCCCYRSATDGDHLTQRIQGEVANQVAGQVIERQGSSQVKIVKGGGGHGWETVTR